MRLARRLAICVAVSAVSLLMTAAPVTAAAWVESGDAGDLPGAAQIPIGAGSLASISGTLPMDPDVDMFRINIVDKTNFAASLSGLTQFADPDLWLFSAGGNGVAANNTVAFGNCTLTGANVPTNGIYYLAVSANNRSALSSGGDIWQQAYHGDIAPNGAGAAQPITGWGGIPVVTTMAYTVQLTGAEFVAVPEPGILSLVTAGASGMLLRRRSRRSLPPLR